MKKLITAALLLIALANVSYGQPDPVQQAYGPYFLPPEATKIRAEAGWEYEQR